MTTRSRPSQAKHDETVRRIAGGYKSQGWTIHADVRGYSKPHTIYGKRPDVIAQKGTKTRIIEVETPDSFKKDIQQRNAFKLYASHSSKREFRTKITGRK